MSIGNNTGWRLGAKDQQPSKIKNHYYVFVNLMGPGELPEYVIMPKHVLATYLKREHTKWLSGRKRDGTKRKDSNIRVFAPKRKSAMKLADKYRNNWDALGLW